MSDGHMWIAAVCFAFILGVVCGATYQRHQDDTMQKCAVECAPARALPISQRDECACAPVPVKP